MKFRKKRTSSRCGVGGFEWNWAKLDTNPIPTCCVSIGRPVGGSGSRRLCRQEHEPARDPAQHQHRRHQHQSAEPLPILRRRPAEPTRWTETDMLLVQRPCWAVRRTAAWCVYCIVCVYIYIYICTFPASRAALSLLSFWFWFLRRGKMDWWFERPVVQRFRIATVVFSFLVVCLPIIWTAFSLRLHMFTTCNSGSGHFPYQQQASSLTGDYSSRLQVAIIRSFGCCFRLSLLKHIFISLSPLYSWESSVQDKPPFWFSSV